MNLWIQCAKRFCFKWFDQILSDSNLGLELKLGQLNLFPKLEQNVYWNHAAISPPSVLTAQAVQAVLNEFACRGSDAFICMKTPKSQEEACSTIGGPSGWKRFHGVPYYKGIQAIAYAFGKRIGEFLYLRVNFNQYLTQWQACLRQNIPLSSKVKSSHARERTGVKLRSI